MTHADRCAEIAWELAAALVWRGLSVAEAVSAVICERKPPRHHADSSPLGSLPDDVPVCRRVRVLHALGADPATIAAYLTERGVTLRGTAMTLRRVLRVLNAGSATCH